MNDTLPVVRRLAPQDWPRYRDVRLRALRDSPDAFGSTLEREAHRTDAHWQERLTSAATSEWDLPVVIEQGDQFVGLVWGKIDPSAAQTTYVFQMWVAPDSRARGYGAMLLDAIVVWARGKGARQVLLNVTCGDTAAMRLYARAGFRPAGEPEPLRPGSTLLAQPLRLEL